MLKRMISIPALFALSLLFGTLHAQPAPTQAPDAAPQIEIDATLKSNFVAAYVDILEIQMRYAEQLQSVTDEAEANGLQQAAQGEMQEAVESNDLTVQEYNLVIQTASSDPDLMAELEAAIEAAS